MNAPQTVAQPLNIATQVGEERPVSRTMHPVGPGGLPGRIFRMVVMCCTGGLAFPNVWVEGMDPTELDRQHYKE